MSTLRDNLPQEIGGFSISEYSDFDSRVRTVFEDNSTHDILLPATNMLSYVLSNGAEVMIRPSGTEPKMKIYITTAEASLDESQLLTDSLVDAATKLIGQ
ncbi:MAG: phospho-sugar mutase, partial [Oscillospiraceae bacterium]|nr:phospho-sugar mutase [Oscillospiraceae bacterium]